VTASSPLESESEKSRTPPLPLSTDPLLPPQPQPPTPQTDLELTPFCDAVSRGDVDMASFLLRDSRVDPSLGSRAVARPVLYPAMAGSIDMLKLLAEHRLLNDEVETMLYRTAAANRQTEALHFVENFYIDLRPLEALTPGRQLVKIRREFAKFDDDGNGFCDNGELRDLFSGLGVPLTEEEFGEAFTALNTAGDNRIDLDELTTFWLGQEGYASALAELRAAGGYGGFVMPLSAYA
jgi:Ca2+-binding EF-hand superfamily protein